MKRTIAFLLTILLILSLTGCSSSPKRLEITGAAKIQIFNMSTGKQTELTDAADIAYITENICSLPYSKGRKVNSDGSMFSLSWLDETGERIAGVAVLSENTIVYQKHYYKVMTIDYEIDLAFLEDLFTD